MLISFRGLRKFSGGPWLSKIGISCAKTPRTPTPEVQFFCGSFDAAQDMLCAFARDIPSFGCGVAAL
jgi:hypothetical protein